MARLFSALVCLLVVAVTASGGAPRALAGTEGLAGAQRHAGVKALRGGGLKHKGGAGAWGWRGHGGCGGSLRLRGGDDALDARLKGLISASDVVVFMKGTRDTPKCGFSAKMIALFEEYRVPFTTFDILADDEVRQGLKAYSNWPTYPQVYAHGKLVGGLDVLNELAAEGELLSELGVTPEGDDAASVSPAALEGKIKRALGAERVEVEDLSDGCGGKFSALVVSAKFEGMPLIDRQRAVHESIKAEMASIHALTLKCKTPAQAAAAGL